MSFRESFRRQSGPWPAPAGKQTLLVWSPPCRLNLAPRVATQVRFGLTAVHSEKNLVRLLQNEYFIGLCLECDKMSVFQGNEGSENVVTRQWKHPFAMSINTAALPLLLVITVGCCGWFCLLQNCNLFSWYSYLRKCEFPYL